MKRPTTLCSDIIIARVSAECLGLEMKGIVITELRSLTRPDLYIWPTLGERKKSSLSLHTYYVLRGDY